MTDFELHLMEREFGLDLHSEGPDFLLTGPS